MLPYLSVETALVITNCYLHFADEETKSQRETRSVSVNFIKKKKKLYKNEIIKIFSFQIKIWVISRIKVIAVQGRYNCH